MIVAQRLRKGQPGSSRGAARLVGDALASTGRLDGMSGVRMLMRAGSEYYGHAAVAAAIAGGADVSVTVRMDPAVKKAIAAIDDSAWQSIKYTDPVYDEDTGRWVSKAEVAEIDYTAFTSKKKSQRIPGRLVVCRIPELNPKNLDQPTLFDTHRFHALFTTSDLDTVTATTPTGPTR